MKKVLLAVLIVAAFTVGAYAVRVNPTSNVIADTAATASTIVYRNTSGTIDSGSLDTASILAGSINTDKIAPETIDTSKFKKTAVGVGYVACIKVDGTVGICNVAPVGISCTCQ